MKLDLHLHSANSIDSVNSEKTIVETCKKKGIGFALTDHDSIAGWNKAESSAKKLDVPFIRGEEILILENGRILGEVIGLFMEDFVKNGNVFDVLDDLKKQDALVTVPHPFDSFRKGLFCNIEKSEWNAVVKKIDAVEVFNGRVHLKRFNSRAQKFAEEKKLGKTAGSDAHTPEEIGNAFIECNASSLEECRGLIKKGKISFSGKIAPLKAHFLTQLAKRKIIHEK